MIFSLDEDDIFTDVSNTKLQRLLTEETAVVINVLQAVKHLLKEDNLIFSYPYDWRTQKPMVTHVCKQWFVIY